MCRILNSDDPKYGGSGVTNGTVRSKKGEKHGFEQYVSLTLPPLSTLYFQVPAARKPRAKKEEEAEAKPAAKTKKATAAKAAPKRTRTTKAKPQA